MSDAPDNPTQPDESGEDFEVDILSRLREQHAPKPRPAVPFKPKPETEPEEEFWAAFSMIAPTGERFAINVCFRSQQHYNSEMSKFETAKNIHIVVKDANEESVVIKRDMLLHVLPSGHKEVSERKW